MKLYLSILFAICYSIIAQELPELDAFQRRLAEQLLKVQTIQSDFVQTREMPALEMKLESTGRLAFDAAAQRLLWRVETPLPCAFRLQDGKLTQWDGEKGEVLTISAAKLPWLKLLQERLGQWLSGDLPALRKEAAVALVAANRVRLTPNGGVLALIAAAVEIEFSDDLSRVTQIRLEEKSGDRLAIRFRNTILNQPIPAAAWELQ